MGSDLTQAIDKAVQAREALKPKRGHLGASQIGARCLRQSFYAFRWAYQEKHTGRLLRLFSRGHEEEFRFVEYLRLAGAEVRDYHERLMYHDGSDAYLSIDWDARPSLSGEEEFDRLWAECDDVSEDRAHIERASARGEGPKQWGFEEDFGTGGKAYFSGSSDGMVHWPEHCPEGWGGLEFKTHNDKSFKNLTAKGVLSSKPVHYIQMQIYMHYMGLPWCLYLAVNKNDDEIYDEVVHYKREVAEFHIDRARQVVQAVDAPARITEDPSWWGSRFCAFREICHYQDPPQKNCRSCAFAEASPDGWRCKHWHALLPPDFIPQGCDNWSPIS